MALENEKENVLIFGHGNWQAAFKMMMEDSNQCTWKGAGRKRACVSEYLIDNCEGFEFTYNPPEETEENAVQQNKDPKTVIDEILRELKCIPDIISDWKK